MLYGIDNKSIVNNENIEIQNGVFNLPIRNAQEALNRIGYKLVVDGKFGKNTDRSIKDFEKKNNIECSGKLSKVTYTKLLTKASIVELDFWKLRASKWIFPMKKSCLMDPTIGSRAFGSSRGSRAHAGIDLYASKNDEVIACTSGKVTKIYNFYAGTNCVEVLNDDGSVIRYAEISAKVKIGDKVQQGNLIGVIIPNKNNYKNMLHLEIYSNEENGPLTVRRDNLQYKYVTNNNYERRTDLIDPTGVIYLEIKND